MGMSGLSVGAVVSLSKLVHDVGEPIIVKFSAAANHKDITINGVHIIQDVLLGDKKISVAVHSLLNPKIAESSYDSKQKVSQQQQSNHVC
ncbi:hypothetical protein SARC_08680 [Sphaeroforma arctica JP610]|uniref:Uncharacterized protein n=1 Tax=Sphaeroforma arctica JP610 TaxID=667725 RepID=A0A0L0FQC4_9EUKA|nr:hypothetical protein SARC_08680 [Sphaeroforma arctica JP610]KNC78904.1 hypothetical protein SARC_08680 [Sphaeroforma arctica JP610]|eukprot:XP_014152806.1 hypothetical protein SARC_08680 [Sphaeroforma arctica JP610]